MARVVKPIVAALLAVLLLLVQAAAVSPDLHHWFHADTGGASHDCAAVLLQKGLAEGAPPVFVVAPPASAADPLPVSALPTPAAADRELPPGRAPPLA
jgi:hypothetical protein